MLDPEKRKELKGADDRCLKSEFKGLEVTGEV